MTLTDTDLCEDTDHSNDFLIIISNDFTRSVTPVLVIF